MNDNMRLSVLISFLQRKLGYENSTDYDFGSEG